MQSLNGEVRFLCCAMAGELRPLHLFAPLRRGLTVGRHGQTIHHNGSLTRRLQTDGTVPHMEVKHPPTADIPHAASPEGEPVRVHTVTDFGRRPAPLLSSRFALFLAATAAFFLGLFLQQSSLPQFLGDRGYTAGIVGLVIGILSVGATLPRWWLGRAMDQGALVPLLVVGSALLLTSPLYGLGDGALPALLAVRAVQGISAAVWATGGPLLVTLLTPPARRGEAVGLFSLATTLAISVGPPLGLIVGQRVGYWLTFALCGLSGVVSALLLLPFLRKMRAESQQATTVPVTAPAPRGSLFEWAVLPAAVPGFVLGLSNGALFAFIVPLMDGRNLPGAGFFFTIDAVAFFAVRAVGGRWADRYGRWRVIVPGLGVLALSLAVLAAVPTFPAFVVAALLWGGGISIVFPDLNTLAIDLAPPGRRGAAAATYTGIFEIGVACGGILLGWLADRTSLPFVFAVAAALLAVASIGCGWRNRAIKAS